MNSTKISLWAQALDNQSVDHCYQVDASGYAIEHKHPEQVAAAVFKIVQNGKNDKDSDQLHSIDVYRKSGTTSVVIKFPVFDDTQQPIRDAVGRRAVITMVIQDLPNMDQGMSSYFNQVNDGVLKAIYPQAAITAKHDESRTKIDALLKKNLAFSNASKNGSTHCSRKTLLTIGVVSLTMIVVWQLTK